MMRIYSLIMNNSLACGRGGGGRPEAGAADSATPGPRQWRPGTVTVTGMFWHSRARFNVKSRSVKPRTQSAAGTAGP